MQLRLGIEIYSSFFIAFAVDDTFPVCKINILPVKPYQLPYSHTGRAEKINQSQIPQTTALIPQLLQGFIGKRILDFCSGPHLMDPSDRVFQDIILFFQPTEQTGQIPSDIVNRGQAAVIDFLIICKILTQILCGHPLEGLLNGLDQMLSSYLIIGQSPGRTAFHLFCSQKHLQIFLVAIRLLATLLLLYIQLRNQALLQGPHLSRIQFIRHFFQNTKDDLFHIVPPEQLVLNDMIP